MTLPHRVLPAWSLLALLIMLPSCIALGPRVDAEPAFGHRVEGETADGRTTIAINPPQDDVQYRLFDATYESVSIRPDELTPDRAAEGVSVEVLVKGAFPDSCSELHNVVQERAGNLILVTLTMRRPQGSVCASVLRPYRYYLDLDGSFTAGSYSLRLNEVTHAFVVRESSESR